MVQRRRGVRPGDGFGVVIGERDLPAAVGLGSRGAQVTTEVDEGAAAEHGVDAVGGPVRGEGFCGRAEVEVDAAREDDQALGGVEEDAVPAGCGLGPPAHPMS